MAEKQRQPSKTEELVEVSKQVASLWMDFRSNFRKAFSSHEITSDEERQFLEVKSHLSRLQRVLTQRLPEGFRWGSKAMTELMQQCISIASLRELPMTDKKALYQEWHEAYIALENLLGVLDVLAEGFPVDFQAASPKTGNIKQRMANERKTKAKGSAGKVFLVVVLLAAAAGVVWYQFIRPH